MKRNKNIGIILFIVILIIINIIVNTLNLSLDLTNEKRYSMSLQTKNILSSLDDRLYIKVYLKGEFPSGFKKLQQETEQLLFKMRNIAKSNIDFEFINPSLNDTEKEELFRQLINQGLLPTDLQLKKQDKLTSQIIFPGAIIYYKDKYMAINFLKNNIGVSASENINSSIENLEYEFISSINKLISTDNKKIAFLEGNKELSAQEVYDISESVLENNFNLSFYYNVDRFNIKLFPLDSIKAEVDISRQLEKLNEYKLIIIAKPKEPFNNLEKYLIDQYIMHGGKVIWLIDGVVANMDTLQKNEDGFIAVKNRLNLDDQLFKYGVRVNSDLIQDMRATEIPIVTGYTANMPQQTFFKWPYYPLLFSTSHHPISKGLDAIKCDFVSSIDTIKNNIKKTILLHSSSNSRVIPSPSKVSLSILKTPGLTDSYNKRHIPIAVLLEGEFESIFHNRLLPKKELKIKSRSKENQMIIISDGDMIANRVTEKGNIFPLGYDRFIDFVYPGNKQFLINAVHYLCDDSNLLDLKTKELKLRLLDKSNIKKYKLLIQILNTIVPLLFLVLISIFFNIYRRNMYAK
ncbi:MAG: gliding motility-associated ABC transporter substrate-binding protein GldG [Bacteroidota bacterium]|nr:gliding motility-associated ABC transporter substrate-binding protein GldG [Bacteroidota bacterium]